MMMMAELVQGQAAIPQPGLKADGFADALHRARQVTRVEQFIYDLAEVETGLLNDAKALLFELAHVSSLCYALKKTH